MWLPNSRNSLSSPALRRTWGDALTGERQRHHEPDAMLTPKKKKLSSVISAKK